jgi:hypothetical protein
MFLHGAELRKCYAREQLSEPADGHAVLEVREQGCDRQREPRNSPAPLTRPGSSSTAAQPEQSIMLPMAAPANAGFSVSIRH